MQNRTQYTKQKKNMMLTEKNIRKWRNQFQNLIVQSNKLTKMIMHSDKKPETYYIDNEIVEWILMNRKLGITITSWEGIVKASTIKEELKKKA